MHNMFMQFIYIEREDSKRDEASDTLFWCKKRHIKTIPHVDVGRVNRVHGRTTSSIAAHAFVAWKARTARCPSFESELCENGKIG